MERRESQKRLKGIAPEGRTSRLSWEGHLSDCSSGDVRCPGAQAPRSSGHEGIRAASPEPTSIAGLVGVVAIRYRPAKSLNCECGHAAEPCQLTTLRSSFAPAHVSRRRSVLLRFLLGLASKLARFCPSCNNVHLP